MATAVATVEEGSARPKGPSIIVQAGILVVLSVVSAGIGWVAGGALDPGPASEKADHAPAGGHDKKDDAGEEPIAQPNLVMLPGITTNIAAPTDIWLRLEVGLVFDGPPDAAVADAIHQDMLAFLRTVKLHQVEGASGFQHLKDDLEERARIRSDGKARKVLIRTLLFE